MEGRGRRGQPAPTRQVTALGGHAADRDRHLAETAVPGVPTLSRFYGIRIRMNYREHGPPHFHAEYGEYEALTTIDDLRVLSGHLPPRALRLVRTWAARHRADLLANWDLARSLRPLRPIRGLE